LSCGKKVLYDQKEIGPWCTRQTECLDTQTQKMQKMYFFKNANNVKMQKMQQQKTPLDHGEQIFKGAVCHLGARWPKAAGPPQELEVRARSAPNF
jgi:hypothetical protein